MLHGEKKEKYLHDIYNDTLHHWFQIFALRPGENLQNFEDFATRAKERFASS